MLVCTYNYSEYVLIVKCDSFSEMEYVEAKLIVVQKLSSFALMFLFYFLYLKLAWLFYLGYLCVTCYRNLVEKTGSY